MLSFHPNPSGRDALMLIWKKSNFAKRAEEVVCFSPLVRVSPKGFRLIALFLFITDSISFFVVVLGGVESVETPGKQESGAGCARWTACGKRLDRREQTGKT
jgi:hypothetical protein